MKLKIFDYETSLQNAGADFTARTPHAIRVVCNTGNGKPGIMDVPQQATAEVFQSGTVMDGWDDGLTHPIGSVSKPVVVFTGGDAPPERSEVPEINDYAVFGDKDFLTCTGGSKGKLICYYDFSDDNPEVVESGLSYRLKLKCEYLEPLTEDEDALYNITVVDK